MEKPKLTKLLNDVFAPQDNEKVLIITDNPHNNIRNNPDWVARKDLAQEWLYGFKELSKEKNITVDYLEFPATGSHNAFFNKDLISKIKPYNIIVAMTEYSATAPLRSLCMENKKTMRIASMPQVEKRMENSAFLADYSLVKKYALSLQKLLKKSISADILFTTGEKLYIDLRENNPIAGTGDYTQNGTAGNFPAGETFTVPYEGLGERKDILGQSQTKGILPFYYDNELVKFHIEENNITSIEGNGAMTEKMREYFDENKTRRNIAELGLGCNPNAEVTGNVLEDEKAGLHIAYGTSSHFGGEVTSDVHEDLVYASGCPIEGKLVTLNHIDGSSTNLIIDGLMNYDIL